MSWRVSLFPLPVHTFVAKKALKIWHGPVQLQCRHNTEITQLQVSYRRTQGYNVRSLYVASQSMKERREASSWQDVNRNNHRGKSEENTSKREIGQVVLWMLSGLGENALLFIQDYERTLVFQISAQRVPLRLSLPCYPSRPQRSVSSAPPALRTPLGTELPR